MKNIFQASLLLIFGAVIFYECTQASSKTPAQLSAPTKKVKTIVAEPINYGETVFASGKLASSEEMKLSFKTGGIVKRILVSEGQTVRKGQLLAELDLSEINALTQQADLGVTAAKISIKDAELAVERAERTYNNALGLYQDSVATYEQLHDAELNLKNMRNQLEAAQTNLNVNQQNKTVAGFNQRFSKITAPSNGIILKKMAESNELVGTGTPVFLFGTKDKAKVIRVNLTDKDIIFVSLGDEVSIEFDAYPADEFKGSVTEIASLADPYTNTYEVEIAVDENDKKLLSGFIGKVNIRTKTQEKLVKIPIDAMISGHQREANVFVVNDNRAKKIKVGLYKIEGDNLLINSGLEGGEEIIAKGGEYLDEGDSIQVN